VFAQPIKFYKYSQTPSDRYQTRKSCLTTSTGQLVWQIVRFFSKISTNYIFLSRITRIRCGLACSLNLQDAYLVGPSRFGFGRLWRSFFSAHRPHWCGAVHGMSPTI
jgi:hypothetical protein